MTWASGDLRWWSEKGPRHDKVTQLVQGIQERAGYRRGLNTHHLRLYADRQVSGLTAGTYSGSAMNALERRPRLSINVIRNCIDAVTSLVTKTRPRATFLTDGGSWDMQQRAKKRGHFVEAVFQSEDAYQLGQRAFKDAAIFGTGFIKVCREHGRIRLEKTFPGEVLVDDAEAIYGEPRSFFQVRTVDRLVLKEIFPGHAKDVEATNPPDTRIYGRSSIADQVVVVEGWHLASGPNAEDGRHVIVVDKATLLDEAYPHEAPPFAVIRWSEDTLGWYGTGVAQELTGIQYEINQLIRGIQSAMHMGGNLKILIERGSKIVAAHLNNDIRGTVVEYSGTPPHWIAPDTVSNQMLMHLQWLVDQAYAVTGISQTAARSEVPAGLSGSGRSLLVYQNIESQRFVTVQRQYERFFMDLAERVLEAASDLYEQDGDFMVTHIGDDWAEKIGFDDIAGNDDEFHIQVFPTSMLPATPAGRLAMVEQLRLGGYLDAGQAKKLLDFPDITAEMDMDLAPGELIDERIGLIIEKGEYHAPHPRMDVELAMRRATLAYQRSELRHVPQDRLELLGQFIDECSDLLEVAAAAAPAPPMVPTGPDMGAEMPMDGGGMAPANGAGAPMPPEMAGGMM